MSSSREESPDWLRSFQAPSKSVLTLSSDSESLPKSSPSREAGTWHQESSQLPEDSEKETDQDADSDGITIASAFDKYSKSKSSKRPKTGEHTSPKKKKIGKLKKREADEDDREIANEGLPEKPSEPHAGDHSILALSSDSESCPRDSPLKENQIHHEESSEQQTIKFQRRRKGKDKDKDTDFVGSGQSPSKKSSKEKSPKKKLKLEDDLPTEEKSIKDDINRKGYDGDLEVAEQETHEKRIEPRVSSSRLPLVLSEKVQRAKALVECDGESIDLSGDMGAVGRVVISESPSGNHEMYMDLKGTIYRTTIVPCRTFCVVSFGPSEAKIEAIMDDFIQLTPQSNVYEAETMVEGTLDGFSFDSEDEAEKMPKATTNQTDQAEGVEEQTNGKGKGKAKKVTGAAQKKGKAKATGAKSQPAKKVRKKTQVSKKVKARK